MSGDRVPLFQTFESQRPRLGALLHGAILSLAIFTALSLGIRYGGIHPLRAARGPGDPWALATRSSMAEREPEVDIRGTLWSRIRAAFSFSEAPDWRSGPAGQQLEEWLRASNGGSYDSLRLAYARPLANAPADAAQPASWSEWLRRFGPLQVRKVEQSGPSQILIQAQAANGSLWRMALGPAAGPPSLIDTLMAQFDTSDLVALGEWHASKEDSDLRMRIIHHPDFPVKVRSIVVECGNARYQPLLDRYIAGEEVPWEKLQQVWRDVSTPGACDSPVYPQFLTEVRSLNRGLPKQFRVRVLAGDAPIDWARIAGPEQWRRIAGDRDKFAADLIEREVLRQGRKGLLIYGAGHFWRHRPSLAALIDKDFPGRLYTVARVGPITGAPPVLLSLGGFGAANAQQFLGRDVPSGLTVADLADVGVYGGKTADTTVPPDRSVEADKAYLAEKERRLRLIRR